MPKPMPSGAKPAPPMPKPAPPEQVKLTPEELEAYKQDMEERKLKKTPPPTTRTTMGQPFSHGGKVKTSSTSKRADGIAQRGKTRGKYV